MKTLFINCGMGAAGDMLTAALLELIPDKNEFLNELNYIGIPGVTFVSEAAAKCGIQGTHISVKVDGVEESEDMHDHDHHHEHDHEHHHDHDHDHHHEHEHDHEHHHDHEHEHDHHHDHDHDHEHHHHAHHHSNIGDISAIVNGLAVSEKVKRDVINVYQLIAEAESHVHGVPVTDIHFHEVGTKDAIADVTAVCMLMEKIAPDKVIASPVHVGSGQVRCAHGILPVPAPATAHILKDVPIYGGEIKGELCTPTGAALLKYFAGSFGDMPIMKTTAIGYGMGKKDFPVANCVRVMLGDTEDKGDTVIELLCNIDDMTAEAIGFAEEQLFAAGALDVYTIPIQMKKSRPGVILGVMCKEEKKENILAAIFKHTTTIGIRENVCKRYTLNRSVETISTQFGDVRKKVSYGYGVKREKTEYEDIARIAREQNMSINEVCECIGSVK